MCGLTTTHPRRAQPESRNHDPIPAVIVKTAHFYQFLNASFHVFFSFFMSVSNVGFNVCKPQFPLLYIMTFLIFLKRSLPSGFVSALATFSSLRISIKEVILDLTA